MTRNQKGFSALGVILMVLVVGSIVGVGWYVYNQNKVESTTTKQESNNINSKTQEHISRNPYQGWKTGSFKYAKLSYKIPPHWQDISDNTKFQDTEFKYEEVKIKAADGFTLSMSINNLPRGYEGEPNNAVLEFKNIDSMHQWITADNENGKVSRIYVGSGVRKVGEKILPVPNVGKDGLNIELIGLYDDELNSLEIFNQKLSVIEAKLVFESLKFE